MRNRIMTGCVGGVLLGGLLAANAGADPLGSSYTVLLDAVVTDGEYNVFSGHFGDVAFDEALNGVPNDFPPQDAPNGAFVDGNPLWVNEHITVNDDGSETIDIWIFGDEDGDEQTVPQPGEFGKLFTNDVATQARPDADPNTGGESLGVSFEILDLVWADAPQGPIEFELLDLGLTFNGGVPDEVPVPIEPFFIDSFGEGTEDDPFDIIVGLDPADFANMPTDLHMTFTIRHIPEPASLALFGAGMMLLIRRGRG